jgi:asparagine synthase (glutamine-hydrolysing)
MCGIVGIYNFRGGSSIDENVLTDMRDTMFHRGPDGAGNWISKDHSVGLGHRRLSIIDLSTSASQPMPNQDESIWVTYNGEIYNHLMLRDELVTKGYVFRTDHSDTEILVHGIQEWGIDGLVEKLAGDYGIGLWDQNSETMHLIRDRAGTKPLYLSFVNGVLIFASEIKALLKYPGLKRQINPQAAYHYLSFMTTPAPMTMFEGIYKVPAGHYISFKKGEKVVAKRYWDPVTGQGIDSTDLAGLSDVAKEDFYVRGIRERLDGAVGRRMMSDVPFGVFLSGGIDSSTNVALMAQHMDRPVDTFTVGFKDHSHLNELDSASLVSQKFNTKHHEILIDEGDMIGYLEQMVNSQDEPIADWVCIPLYFVSKLAKDSGATVVQVGEGADEQFCGYDSWMAYRELYRKYWNPFQQYLPKFAQYSIAAAAKLAASVRPNLLVYADIIDRASRDREHFWSGVSVFSELAKAKLLDARDFSAPQIAPEMIETGLLPPSYLEPDSFNIVNSFFERLDRESSGKDNLARMAYSDLKLRLPELLLMRVDKIGMSTSLEARVPFLDHKLIEFSMDIPEEFKVRGNNPKHLLKKAVRGLIPDAIIDRKKMGFGAPMAEWMRGPFGVRARDSILNSPVIGMLNLDKAFIFQICEEHISARNDYAVWIWVLFNLVEWHRYWIEERN